MMPTSTSNSRVVPRTSVSSNTPTHPPIAALQAVEQAISKATSQSSKTHRNRIHPVPKYAYPNITIATRSPDSSFRFGRCIRGTQPPRPTPRPASATHTARRRTLTGTPQSNAATSTMVNRMAIAIPLRSGHTISVSTQTGLSIRDSVHGAWPRFTRAALTAVSRSPFPPSISVDKMDLFL